MNDPDCIRYSFDDRRSDSDCNGPPRAHCDRRGAAAACLPDAATRLAEARPGDSAGH